MSWKQWVALAAICEEEGLEGLFRSDHYLSIFAPLERGSLDAWTTFAGLAALTKRLRLGTLVSPVTFRHPSHLAKTVTTVDHISGGRAELGLGLGWYELEHSAYGFPFPTTAARMELLGEQIELIHRQWSEDSVTFVCRHYSTERCRALPKPLQQPRPPLIIGGRGGPKTIALAVRFADEYNFTGEFGSGYATPPTCRERRLRLHEACEQGGRDPATIRFSLMAACVIGTDRPELLERVRRALARTGESLDPEHVLTSRANDWILGTVDGIVARLRELGDVGVERVYLQHLDHSDLEAVRLIAREVAPALS